MESFVDQYFEKQLISRIIHVYHSRLLTCPLTLFSFCHHLAEQKTIYQTIMKSVRRQKGGVFFLHGYGGTSKTFMWRTLASYLRSRGKLF
jgi:hypothetical protein